MRGAASLLLGATFATAAAAQPAGSLAADRAFARWVLEAAPPGAVLLADGPADAPVLLQAQGEGLRPDVAVVPFPSLAAPEAARALAERHGLPLPDSVETFAPRLGDRGSTDTPEGRLYTLADRVLDHWLSGALDRPLVAAVTLNPAVLGTKTDVADRGATLVPAPMSAFDASAAWASMARLDGADFAAPADLDPGRLDPGGIVLFQMLQTAVTFAQSGDPEAAERVYVAAATFARTSGRPGDPLVEAARFWIDDALADR
ncbi:MAG: hypothetical protein AAF845_19130 [Bacteroidota bacterium]